MSNLTSLLRTCTAVISMAMLFSSAAYAASVNVFVDGRSGPWNIAANPTYSYGGFFNGRMDNHLAPTSVSSFSGFSFTAGNSLSLEYVSGLANSNAGPSDANGNLSWGVLESYGGSPAPGHYIAGNQYIEQLVGAYANSNGVIVGSPFAIGNSLWNSVIPIGATQLVMGFNDVWSNDNSGGLNMKVTGITAPVPEPETYAMLLAGLGLLGFMARRRKNLAA